MFRFTLVVVALYAICCAMALGQVTLQPAGGAAQPDRTAGEAPPPSIGVLMQRNGGSLLRATQAAPADPARAKLSDVSAFAVPEPTPKTVKKHDLVTIIIREETQSSSTGTTDLKKEASLDAKIDSYIKLNLAKLSLQGNTPTVAPELSLSGNRSFKGDATADRSDSLTARIAAEVIDVKPNNTLVLQARKRIKNDEEEQQFVLTGNCRADDITADNTVLSTQIYDLEFLKNSKGAVRATTKRGWVPKLLDFVNIF